MGEFRPFGSDQGMYGLGITKEVRRQTQLLNRPIILAAASPLVETAVVGKVVTVPLVGLVCNQVRSDDYKLELEICAEDATLAICHPRINDTLAFMKVMFIEFRQDILEILFRFETAYGFEGNGLCSSLFLTEDCLIRRAMRLLDFDRTMPHIFGHVVDTAHAAHAAYGDEQPQRVGWTKAISLEAGYSDDFDLLTQCLGRKRAEGAEGSTVKVYQDLEKGIKV